MSLAPRLSVKAPISASPSFPRIAFAARGGRINTDAIDNSAGVNCSDVEVNIKIALANAIKSGALKADKRDALLADMTEEVARLVLQNNYEQTLCLTLAQSRGASDMDYQQRLMRELESRELLDRAVEDLPDDLALAERRAAGEPLTPPRARGPACLCQDHPVRRHPEDRCGR